MTLDQINKRLKEIRSLLINDDECNVDELEIEVRELQEEKAELEEKQKRQDIADKLNNGELQGRTLKTGYEKPEEAEEADQMPKIILRKNDRWIDRKNTEKENKLDIGKYIRGMVTGQWENAEAEKRAMNTTATGVLIPEMIAAETIDRARATSLFASSGVPIVAMESDNHTFSKIKSDPDFKFKAEGEEATGGSLELEGVKLKSRTIYGYAWVTIEAIKSSLNLTDVINMAFSNALAQGLDRAFLYGQDDGQGGFAEYAPEGILNDPDINSITADGVDYDDIVKAISKTKQSNSFPTIWGLNAKSEELFSLLKDSQGRYLTPPKMVTDMEQIISNQLLHDETEGSTSLVFDPYSMIIGIQEDMSIRMLEGTDEGVKKGLVCFRIMAMADCKLLHPKHICKITGIKENAE